VRRLGLLDSRHSRPSPARAARADSPGVVPSPSEGDGRASLTDSVSRATPYDSAMTERPSTPSIAQELRRLQEKLETYTKGHTNPTGEVLADLAKGIHELGDHMIALHERLESLEANTPQWTTRGWEPPPGADSGTFVNREE